MYLVDRELHPVDGRSNEKGFVEEVRTLTAIDFHIDNCRSTEHWAAVIFCVYLRQSVNHY